MGEGYQGGQKERPVALFCDAYLGYEEQRCVCSLNWKRDGMERRDTGVFDAYIRYGI